jgi:hypothetical protein
MNVHLHKTASLSERKLLVENHLLEKKLKRQSEMQSRINALMDIISRQKATIEAQKEEIETLRGDLSYEVFAAK